MVVILFHSLDNRFSLLKTVAFIIKNVFIINSHAYSNFNYTVEVYLKPFKTQLVQVFFSL